MFQQAFNQIPERNSISFKPTNSKSIIRIQKSKLPANFFKPLSIEVDPRNSSEKGQEVIATPCFGNHQQQDPKYFQLTKPSQFRDKYQKQQFYSWFSKGLKPLSSRVQTVPIDMQSSKDQKRHLTERRKRMERVKSVQQEGGKSAFKVLKKYQNLIGDKIESEKLDNYYKFKIKPVNSQGIQKNFKNHFKVNSLKRGYAQTKYKHTKALNSIGVQKQSSTFLPMISSG